MARYTCGKKAGTYMELYGACSGKHPNNSNIWYVVKYIHLLMGKVYAFSDTSSNSFVRPVIIYTHLENIITVDNVDHSISYA